jgi:di/tricarboxylate transporter
VVDARRSVDWQTLIAIAAAFGLSKALMNSGLVPTVATHLGNLTQGFGPYAALAGIYLITSVTTEVVTNNAAAALIFPFAVALASQIHADPRPFVIAVLFAASASFITPIGYQTNMMVYGPGGYRFTDFMRVGLPLHMMLVVTATILIPQIWPF